LKPGFVATIQTFLQALIDTSFRTTGQPCSALGALPEFVEQDLAVEFHSMLRAKLFGLSACADCLCSVPLFVGQDCQQIQPVAQIAVVVLPPDEFPPRRIFRGGVEFLYGSNFGLAAANSGPAPCCAFACHGFSYDSFAFGRYAFTVVAAPGLMLHAPLGTSFVDTLLLGGESR